jgi:hypothetical protein
LPVATHAKIAAAVERNCLFLFISFVFWEASGKKFSFPSSGIFEGSRRDLHGQKISSGIMRILNTGYS